MNPMQSHIKATIFIGLGFALSFLPCFLVLSEMVPDNQAIAVTLWAFLACYSVFLIRWGKKELSKILFPLFIGGIAVITASSIEIYLLFSLMILAWIRSTCFPSKIFKTIFKEVLITGGGAALMLIAGAGSMVSFAIGIWLFFLVQSLYFALFLSASDENKNASPGDAFDKARKAAEKILSGSAAV